MKNKPFLLLEIIAVVLVIAVITLLGIDKYNEFYNNYTKYRVKFNDVDGLSIGSPVRFSGVHVGHVTEQELKNNKIIVTFKITDQNIKIPNGSNAGVEFTGLVGSKSLEIKPPDSYAAYAKELKKIEPVRITSFMEIQNTLSKATLDFFNELLAFLKQNEKNAKKTIKNAAETIKEQSVSFEKIEKTIKEKGEQAAEKTRQIKTFIEDTNKNISNVSETINELTEGKDLNEGLDKLNDAAKTLSEFMESGKLEQTQKKVKKLNSKIIEIKDNEVRYIEKLNGTIKESNEKLQEFINSDDSPEKNQE